MKVRTARTVVLLLAAVFLGGIALLALGGDETARRQLPAQLAAWGTIGALFFAGYWFKVRPRRELARAEAAELRLTSAVGDPLRMLDRGFELLGQVASAKDVENTSWGTWQGRDVVVFDYWFARSSDPGRADHRSFTCATTPVPEGWPDLSIVPRDAFGRVAHALGREGIEFELERFNQAFEVRSGDPRFAHALIDAPMIEWLLGLPEGTGFEILGRTVLAIVPRPTFDVARDALGTLDAFLARVPPVVASLSRDRPRR